MGPFDATRDYERQDGTEVLGIIIKGIWSMSLCRSGKAVVMVQSLLVKANTEEGQKG